MYSIKNIMDGWRNYMVKSEVTEKLAKSRAKICRACDKNVKAKMLIFINDKLSEIEGHKCDVCQCPLSAKVRSKNEKCDLNKW